MDMVEKLTHRLEELEAGNSSGKNHNKVYIYWMVLFYCNLIKASWYIFAYLRTVQLNVSVKPFKWHHQTAKQMA